MAISRMNMERQLRNMGGIMTLEEPRQGYFLGKLVRKAKKVVKKVAKSKVGKAALLAGGAYLAGGFMPSGGGLTGGFANFKKDYKLFPFIVERYISSLLLDNKNNLNYKIFYWNDTRHPLKQVEKIKGLKDVLKNPIIRGYEHFMKGTIFSDKKDFYERIWFQNDIERLDKVIPGGGRRLRNLAKMN